MFSDEATNTNFIVFGLTRPVLEPTIYRTLGEHANHYNIDAVELISIFEVMHIHLLHAGEGNSWTRMLCMFYYSEWNQENTYIVHVKYCWKTYFKSIGTLSQTFKNHIHNNIVTVACGIIKLIA